MLWEVLCENFFPASFLPMLYRLSQIWFKARHPKSDFFLARNEISFWPVAWTCLESKSEDQMEIILAFFCQFGAQTGMLYKERQTCFATSNKKIKIDLLYDKKVSCNLYSSLYSSHIKKTECVVVNDWCEFNVVVKVLEKMLLRINWDLILPTTYSH